MSPFRVLMSGEVSLSDTSDWANAFTRPRYQADIAVWSEQGRLPLALSLAEPTDTLGQALSQSALRLQQRQTNPVLFRLCLGAWGGLDWFNALYAQTGNPVFPTEKIPPRKRDELSTRLANIAGHVGELGVALNRLGHRNLVLSLRGEPAKVGRTFFDALGNIGKRSFVEVWQEGKEMSEPRLVVARESLNDQLDSLIEAGELYADNPSDYELEWDFREIGNARIAFRELLQTLPRAMGKGLTFSIEPETLGYLLRLVPEAVPGVRSLYPKAVWRKLYEPHVVDSRVRPWKVCRMHLNKAEEALTAIWREDMEFYTELEGVALRVLWEAFKFATED